MTVTLKLTATEVLAIFQSLGDASDKEIGPEERMTEPRGVEDPHDRAEVYAQSFDRLMELARNPDDNGAFRVLAEGATSIDGATKGSGLSRAKLKQAMNAGDLAYVQIGERQLIPWCALRGYLASRVVS